jgi:hypothetical protein
MQAAVAGVQSWGGRTSNGYILLDSGSARSYVTVEFAHKLGADAETKTRIGVSCFGTKETRQIDSASGSVRLRLRNGSWFLLHASVVPVITRPLSRVLLEGDSLTGRAF